MNVLIIEDEPLAQEELERLIRKNFPDFRVLDKIDSVEASIAWLQKEHCDLIFMDIELTDGKSFDIFKKVDVKTPIIFTTAYDEYAIQAFQVNSVGYLLKPIDENELKKAVDKLSYSSFAPYPEHSLNQLLNQLAPGKFRERFVAKIGDRYQHININDVAYFYSEDKTTFIRTKGGKQYIIDDTLDKIERDLNPSDYFRLARNIIASIDSVNDVSKYFNSRLSIKLKPEFHEQVLVSRVRVPDFLRWLGS